MTHPYKNAPSFRRWRSAMAAPEMSDVDPLVSFPLRVKPTDRIMTAGSCFAQHIARHLQKSGFNYYVAEKAHPMLPRAVADSHQYGVFTARYGNIYSSRQLLQLIQRAFGRFEPQVSVWPLKKGRVVDPFRPTVNPDGFRSQRELRVDRMQHFANVRTAFRRADVFIFTLGLTEVWVDRADGAAYPVCPGVSGGVFDPERHELVNLSVADVVADMKKAIRFLRRRNPNLKVILTVSPVPLAATAEERHVLVSTIQSKARLVAAADEICRSLSDVFYFPSFEIITGPHARYFAPDLRSVTEEGVAHVMRVFFRHAAERVQSEALAPARPKKPGIDITTAVAEVSEVICDEMLLDAVAVDSREKSRV